MLTRFPRPCLKVWLSMKNVNYDQYDDEIENLNRFGKEYLALQSIERSKSRRGMGGPGAA